MNKKGSPPFDGEPRETPIKWRYLKLGRDADLNLGNSVVVHYNNADFLENDPAKAKFLRIIRREDSDVLTDGEGSDSVGRRGDQDGLSVQLGANMDVSGPEVTVKTSGQDLASGSLVVEGLAESTERSVLIGVANNLRSNKVVLLNEAVGSIERSSLEGALIVNDLAAETTRVASVSGGYKSVEYVAILFLLDGFLRLDLSAVDDVESTSLDLRETNGGVSSDLEGWNEDFLALNDLIGHRTLTGDDSGHGGNVALVAGKSTLGKLVNHQELATNRLILKRAADWLDHCLSKRGATFFGSERLGNDHFLLIIGKTIFI